MNTEQDFRAGLRELEENYMEGENGPKADGTRAQVHNDGEFVELSDIYLGRINHITIPISHFLCIAEFVRQRVQKIKQKAVAGRNDEKSLASAVLQTRLKGD
jgi:hypothetical protein